MINTQVSWTLTVLTVSLILLGPGANNGLASQHDEDKASVSKVQQEADETYRAMKRYTFEQRDEAMASAKEKLRKLDASIEDLQENLEQKWQEMNEDRREKTGKTMKALREQRNEVAEWIGGLRHTSAEAWDEVKKGFSDSYDRLSKAFHDAKENFEK